MESWWMIMCLFVHSVHGTGQIMLNILGYEISQGTTESGECCDGLPGVGTWCFSLCDPYFDVCVDTLPSSKPKECKFGRVTTNALHDQNHATFRDDFAGVPNPVNFSFSEWPADTEGLTLTIDVWDHDTTTDDMVETMDISLYLDPAPALENAPTVPNLSYSGTAVDLVFLVRVFCDPDYYSRDCSVYCNPQNDQGGHYHCGEDGTKLCLPGWEGENCDVDIDECASSPCQNSGTCWDYQNAYYCECPEGYSGVRCESVTDICVTEPCQNGGQCETNEYYPDTLYSCTCLAGYEGSDCEIEVNACDSSPCENGATCQPQGASFVCLCPVGTSGDTCGDIAYGKGRIFFKLLSYDIPGGIESNGNCCDGFNLCASACDPYFRICLDQPNGPTSLEECAYGDIVTGTINDQDNYAFGNDIGGTANPLEIPFNRWYPGGLMVKIDVWDEDSRFNDDFIQFFFSNIDVAPSENSTVLYTFQGRTSLEVEISVRCDPGYSGPVCAETRIPSWA